MTEALAAYSRWTTLRHHATQQAYWNSPHRFNLVPAGRRSGKTELFKRKLVKRALSAAFPWKPAFFAGAPTHAQAKRIFWDDLKALVGRDMMMCDPSETDLKITLLNGAEIWVIGMDKPERVEGSPWDGGGLDEFGNCKATAWGANIRPALSDRNGWFDLFGVPEGRNHYYDEYLKALAQMQSLGKVSDWGVFSWPSRDILSPAEIEAAMRDLDELTFDQEYNASFVNFEGRAYYPFNEKEHCKPLKYDPMQPLIFCFDFNVEPGVAAVIQEQAMPGQYERKPLAPIVRGGPPIPNPQGAPLLDKPLFGSGIIGEVHIPRNSNTPAVCRKLIADWGKHQGPIRCYGDATGGSRGSAKVQGSDWELVEKELKGHFGGRVSMRVKGSNPAERARLNAVNSRLKAKSGDIRMMVDVAKAPNVVRDFDGVVLLKGGAGEIDKKINPKLTHVSDGIGYYVEYEFPVSGPGLYKVQVVGH
jgi:hypothetical protein